MSQTIWSTINPNTTSGTQLATILDDFKNAVVSGLSGTTRPSELQASGGWIDTTNEGTPNFYWSYKIYDGTNDIEIFRVNLNTLKASIPSTDSFFEISKITADTNGALLKFIKQRIANSGQVLSGDTVLDIQAVGRGDDASDPVVARIRVESLDNMGAAASGATIIFEATPQGSTTIQEIFRVIDGKMGIGTNAPETGLDVESSTGVQSKRIEDTVNPSIITQKKKRATGLGGTLNADLIGKYSHQTTDDTGAASEVFTLESTATEPHTATNQGTKLDLKNTDDGSATPSTALSISSIIEHVKPSKLNSLELVIQDVASAATITALDTTKSIVRLTGSTATELQGIDATGNSKVVTIHNGSTADLTLKSENAGASATNRIVLADSADLIIGSDQSVTLFYSASDSRWKVKSSSVGGAGGSGEGGINYIIDANAETSNANVTVTANLTKGFETTNPLFGSQSHSFSIGTGALTTDYFEFDMNAVDLAIYSGGRDLQISFWYETDVNYTSNDVEIRLRDITGAADIIVRNETDGKLQATGVGRRLLFQGKAELNSANSSYSLRGYVLSAPSVASTVVVDKIKASPEEFQPGYIGTTWENFTPTFSNGPTFTHSGFKYRRDGSDVLIMGAMVATGTGGAGVFALDLSSVPILAGKSCNIDQNVGTVSTYLVDGDPGFENAIASSNDTNFEVRINNNGTGSALTGTTITSGDQIYFNVRVHINEWEASNLVSTTERLISNVNIDGRGNGVTVITPNVTNIDFTEVDDNLNTWNGSQFTAPKTGYYIVKGCLQHSSAIVGVFAYIDGTQNKLAGYHGNSVGTTPFGWAGKLQRGEVLSFRSDAGITLVNSTNTHWITINSSKEFSQWGVYGETELISSTVSTFTTFGTSGSPFVMTSLDLPIGGWDITLVMSTFNNGIITEDFFDYCINDLSANFTGTVYGDTRNSQRFISTASSARHSATLPNVNKVINAPTTIYANAISNGTNSGNLQYTCRLSARRVK